MSDRSITRMRHELRMRLLHVIKVVRINRHLVRVTLGGSDLIGFTSVGFDDHVKVFIPPQGAVFNDLPTMGPKGPVFEASGIQPTLRDYTPHHHDPLALTLQLDFALHDAGPATAWAQGAKQGDKLVIGGPRSSFVVGTGFDWHLLIGDDTALPAIRRRCAELPPDSRVIVFAEVEDADHEEAIDSSCNVEVHWIHRKPNDGTASYRLAETIATSVFPVGDFYGWIACESSDAKLHRAALLDRGANRAALKASGYWRRGTVASHDVHE
jgi:NADPH-dependent ferric siderophore reductase